MRYFTALLGIIALVVLVIILVVRGLGGEDTSKELNLPEFANTSTVVRVTIDGPVNAEQDHRGVRITVGRNQAQAEILHGYSRNVVATQTHNSTPEAYATFLRSIHLLGFAKGNTDPQRADERGYCPEGNRYIFEVIDGSQVHQRFWETSCGGGTFDGDANNIIDLFQDQIPQYKRFIRDVDL